MPKDAPTENLYAEIEDRLRPLARPLPPPRPGDWLAENREKGQTFRQYLSARPVRRDRELNNIYLCELGEFDEHQRRVLKQSREYLSLFFDVPVQIRRRVPFSDISARAKRKHPQTGAKQLNVAYILHELLRPDRPENTLAYLALTARDLWPGRGWSFVFGQASLRQRVGVFSIHRNGYPGKSEKAYRLCLRRTLSTATHETGHILTMQHCTSFACLMNGVNHLEEADSSPLTLCPVCLRKLLWNLQAEPVPYLNRLETFCREHGLAEAGWYAKAAAALQT
jgi:archaemetzincin